MFFVSPSVRENCFGFVGLPIVERHRATPLNHGLVSALEHFLTRIVRIVRLSHLTRFPATFTALLPPVLRILAYQIVNHTVTARTLHLRSFTWADRWIMGIFFPDKDWFAVLNDNVTHFLLSSSEDRLPLVRYYTSPASF